MLKGATEVRGRRQMGCCQKPPSNRTRPVHLHGPAVAPATAPGLYIYMVGYIATAPGLYIYMVLA